jgi:hypothetical protein
MVIKFFGNDMHILPRTDLIRHEPKDCVCLPKLSSIVDNGRVVWTYEHSSLDERNN